MATQLQVPNLAGAANPQPFVIGADNAQSMEEKARAIIDRLATQAQEQVALKQPIEQRWLENVRAYHGHYDPTIEAELKERGQSRAYVKITGAKTRALKARLFDLIFPTDDRNWGIEPTPVPKLTKEKREAEGLAEHAAMRANRAEENGNPSELNAALAMGADQGARAVAAQDHIDEMNKAADLMQEQIDDQLVESQYPQECRSLIEDGCKIGTGILKGPIVASAGRGKWIQAETGWALGANDNVSPRARWVDPWSFFPDMSARNIDEAEFTYERHLWTKKMLRKMVRTHGFDPNAVRRLLDERSGMLNGMQPGLYYMAELRSISKDEGAPIKGRYVGWEYHGPLECEEVAILLRAMGDEQGALEYLQRNDPLDELNVVAFFCENELLKIAPEYPLDSGETLYSVFNVDKADGSIFGYGVPDLIGDTQAALNSAWRMGLDNAAMSVMPQAVIDKLQMEPADGSWALAPGKLWLRVKGGPGTEKGLPIEFFDVPNNMEEIAMIIKLAMDFVDLESGIPMPQQGEQGPRTTQTVGGMAILQNAANIVFRSIVKNFDDQIITPLMRRFYDWNMQFNQRDEIKGDMNVDARGTSVLLVKEVQAQNLMLIVTGLMANPTFAAMLKPYDAITKLFQAMMIKPSDVMVSEEEYEKAMEEQAQNQPQDPAVINAQARIQSAQITADSRKISDETAQLVEQMRQRTALIELASNSQMSLEELQGRLGIERDKIASDERKMAAELGFEARAAQEARAHGEEPGGSGGYVSAGGGDEQAAQ